MNHGLWWLWDQVFRTGRTHDDQQSQHQPTPKLTLASMAGSPTTSPTDSPVASPTGSPTDSQGEPQQATGTNAIGSKPAETISQHTLVEPKVRYFRISTILPRPRVTTVSFRLGVGHSISASHASIDNPSRSGPRRKPKRTPPPAGLPLKDRLQSVLQPPLDLILADNRLYLPFEPFEYQYEGIGFLAGRWAAILADEMGLGKTMQSILAIRMLLRAGLIESVVLVCPKPLVSNWLREFSLWAEELPITIVSGDGEARRHSWIFGRAPVKITNYESLSRDAEIIADPAVSFDLVLLDEAQRIKNRDSKTAKVVHSIRRKRSWALTGTPVENRPDDLRSLLDFVHNAGRHGPWDSVETSTADLRQAVGEVILRRTKEMVMEDLPARMTRDVYVDLGPQQRQAYESAEKDGVVRLDGMGTEISIEHVFKLIGQLKQICNFDPATGESAKADLLRSDLEEVITSGKKAIVFSQYVRTLEELANRLGELSPLLYHGGIPQSRRETVLQEFRKRADRPVLLLSYGTGAVGLNLQFANYVFLYDRWWNPAIEDQAINRAHRIGQKDRVFVIRYICPDTIESRIAQILEQKRELFASLIDGHEPSAEDLGMSAEQIFGLFDLKIKSKRAA